MPTETEQGKKVEEQYKTILNYKKQMGFLEKWPEYERFKAGDQWPLPTERTKNLPRPVFNIIDQIQNHKIASVMNENIKMVYNLQEITEDETLIEVADTFTRYADSTWERIKQDQLNEEALESCANIGTSIWHYYWNPTKKGGTSLKWIGEMEGETIDAVNYFPGNPQDRRVQTQPFNIITVRDQVENVKEEAKQNGISKELIELIKPDKETNDQAYDMALQEVNDADKVTVIIKYWRDKTTDRIHFIKVASGIVFKPNTDMGITLYPIVVMQWKRRKKSIFGVGDTEGLIPNQKAINFLLAMELLSAQLTGWPKLLINKNFIQQQISNTPGEVINVTGDSLDQSVKYLNPAQMPSHIPQLVENFIRYTKEVAGANENALGEQNTSQLNATAIMLLQKAAGVPIESIKRRFYQAMEDVGRIWEEFWKVKYNTERMITLDDDDQDPYSVPMNFSNYADMEFNLKIDIGPSSSYSESLMMTSLDKLFDGQHITLEQYLKFAPKNVVPFKDRLLKEIQEQMEQQANDPMALVSQLPPEEQQAFMNAPPEVQQQILASIQQPTPNAMPIG